LLTVPELCRSLKAHFYIRDPPSTSSIHMAAANARSVKTAKSPDAVPESEERVYLYQKSGSESLQELEAKRKRYVDLDESLVQLPRKLRHPGLIPLGPGLFGHGQLVRTNEIMVLLGDSYFAEMSAHEARAVVKRRIALIDDKIAAVEVGKAEVEEILAKGKGKENAENKKESKVQARSPKLKLSGFKKGFLDMAQVEEKFVSGNKPPISPRPSSSSPAKKRVSFSDDTKGGEYESADYTETNGTQNSRSASAMVKELLKNFQGSVALAEEQLDRDETINFEEVYDKDGKLVEVRGIDNSGENVEEQNGANGIGSTELEPAQAELIPEVESASGSESETEIEDTKREGEYIPENGDEKIYTRSDYFEALLRCEKEEEEREERERIAEETATFGSGLMRGFLDAPGKDKKENGANANGNGSHGGIRRGRNAVENTVKERSGRRRRGRKVEGKEPAGAKVFSVGNGNEEAGDGDGAKRMSRFKQSRLKSEQ